MSRLAGRMTRTSPAMKMTLAMEQANPSQTVVTRAWDALRAL